MKALVLERTQWVGGTAVFPYFVLDRGKPGTVVVNAQGRRFVNESASCQLFGERMPAQQSGRRPNPPALSNTVERMNRYAKRGITLGPAVVFAFAAARAARRGKA